MRDDKNRKQFEFEDSYMDVAEKEESREIVNHFIPKFGVSFTIKSLNKSGVEELQGGKYNENPHIQSSKISLFEYNSSKDKGFK